MIGAIVDLSRAASLAGRGQAPERLWREVLIFSRLLEYDIWTGIHARKLTRTHSEDVRSPLGRIVLVELSPAVLARLWNRFRKPGPNDTDKPGLRALLAALSDVSIYRSCFLPLNKVPNPSPAPLVGFFHGLRGASAAGDTAAR